MTWSALDLVVVLLFIAQLVGWGAVFAALWKIKAGPVTRLQTQITPLAELAQKLAQGGGQLAVRLKAQALSLVGHTRTIRRLLNVSEPPTGMWIEPRHVRQALTFAQAVRLRGKAPVVKPSRRKSLANKLGLVPPVLARLAPLGKVARIALQAAKQLRR